MFVFRLICLDVFFFQLFHRDPSTFVAQYEMAKAQTFYDPNNPVNND